MIRLENISKQNGHQLLFIEASAALQKGEKVGLVGPNGAGKTTLFRMITGEDTPDPDQADDMESLIERYGEVQAHFEKLDGYALEARAREVLAGLSFSQEMMDGDVGKLSGGWKM